MAVRLLSSAVVDRAVGSTWDIRVSADELPVLTVLLPDGMALTPAVVFEYDSIGFAPDYVAQYVASVPITVPGRHVGSITTATDGSALAQCYAAAVTLTADMPDADELSDWLGGVDAHSWEDADLTGALNAESAAQRRVCTIPAAYPADLREALLRRAARCLDMRRQLTEQPRTEGGDFDLPPVAPPGRDAEIRRYEGPFRKVVIG